MSPSAPRREAFAAAKVNLFLHVGPLGSDGYHPLSSLIVFADVGDRLGLADRAEPALTIRGRFAAGLSAGPDNLVIRARDALCPDMKGVGLTLDKAVPLAAGLGGGSADAAAALRLLNPLSPVRRTAAEVSQIASGLGSDVPACLESRPVAVTGRGDRLGPAPRLPAIHAVLVNSGAASPTAAVYRAFDESGAVASADPPAWPETLATARDVAAFIALTRNDLETPAIRLEPSIGTVLAALRAAPETLIARMTGSGATAFAICEAEAKAGALAQRLAAAHPGWWVRACRLGGPWS